MIKKNFLTAFIFIILFCNNINAEKRKHTDYVNPFIGTANFGATNPGAVLPNGLMSITPFNVMGESPLNKYDKDAR